MQEGYSFLLIYTAAGSCGVHSHDPEWTRTTDPQFRKLMLYPAELRDQNGEGGIRTHGTGLPYNGFQDRLLKPLGHLSN